MIRTLHRFPRLLAAITLVAAVAGAASAPQPSSPRQPVEAFLRAVLSADENGALDQLSFATPESRQEAQTMLHQIIVTARLRRAMIQQFDARGQETSVGKKEERDAQDLLALVGAADLKIRGDTAELAFDGGKTMHLSRKENQWKINYEKSQPSMGNLPTKDDVDTARKQSAAIEHLTAEVVGRRFTSVQEIEARYNALMVTPATRAAATAPAK